MQKSEIFFLFRKNLLEVNRRRNRKSLLQTLIRERNGSEKVGFYRAMPVRGIAVNSNP
jgi:hypothetical protein